MSASLTVRSVSDGWHVTSYHSTGTVAEAQLYHLVLSPSWILCKGLGYRASKGSWRINRGPLHPTLDFSPILLTLHPVQERTTQSTPWNLVNFGTAIVRIVERHRSRHVHNQVVQRLRILAVCSAEKSTVTYITWNTSSFDKSRIIEFYDSLKKLVPVGTSIYGCHELHRSGESHYHVVFRFPAKVHWPNGRRKFYIEGDTKSIRIENP